MSAQGFDLLNALAADLSAAGDSVAYQAPQVVASSAARLQQVAREKCPKVTHRLERSIYVSLDLLNMSAEIGPSYFVGQFVELGTSKMGPQPFMGPAFDEVAPEFEQALAALGGDVL